MDGFSRWTDFRSMDDLTKAAARVILDAFASSGRKKMSLCLSGGSTPRALYARMAEAAISSQIPWDRVHVFWGDERMVAHAHPDSNFGMAQESLLSHVPIPRDNIHPIRTEGVTCDEAAALYARELQAFHGMSLLDPGRPLFDIALLGLGVDGHTASLFPGTEEARETETWVVGVERAGQPPHVARVSLTVPTLSSSRRGLFLVSGQDKARALAQAKAGDAIPAAQIRSAGELDWFVAA